jgi:Amt family ammonium transporter
MKQSPKEERLAWRSKLKDTNSTQGKEISITKDDSTRKLGYIALLTLIIALSFTAFSPQIESTLPLGKISKADTAWMLSATSLVLLMTPGLGFFYGGMVSARNTISTIFQSFIAMGVITLVWIVIGFSLAFGRSIGGIIGDPLQFFAFSGVGGAPHPTLGSSIPFALFALFQLKFAIITPALISGGFAERIRFTSFLLFIALWSASIYAPLAHWTWNPEGLFFKWGILDFAGGTVVHISAGMAALAGAVFLGRRYSAGDGVKEAEPANVPFVLLGTGLLWFGWFGFNAGSSLAANDIASLAFLNTNTASSIAMLVWLCLDGSRGKKVSALGACIGAVVGLVAITPGAGFVSVKASIFIGAFAAVISNFAVSFKEYLNEKWHLDDTLDVFACHGLGGIVGMILTAVFALKGGVITGDTSLLWSHLLGLAITLPLTFFGSLGLYKLTDLIIPLRVDVNDEALGLDITQHGESTFVVMEQYQRKLEVVKVTNKKAGNVKL